MLGLEFCILGIEEGGGEGEGEVGVISRLTSILDSLPCPFKSELNGWLIRIEQLLLVGYP